MWNRLTRKSSSACWRKNKESMKAKITITLKPGLLDAQGKTIKGALDSLGFKGIDEVRVGKYVEVELGGERSAAAARREVERMCRKLLTNPVIEHYHVDFTSSARTKAGERRS